MMISAATRVISFAKKNPQAIDEEVFQHVSDYIANEAKVRNEKIKIGMIAAASRAAKLARKNPTLPEKELLRQFITEEMPVLVEELDSERD